MVNIDNKKLHAMPDWFGWFMIILAMVLIFPAFSILVESNDPEIWQMKIDKIGLLWALGSVFWSFFAWIVMFALLAIGVDVIRNRDKALDD